MFMQNPPKEKSLYIHTLIFGKNNGIDNIYGYFPDAKVLLGYIQYSFLQEAFYKWIYGKSRVVTKIPSIAVDMIIKEGLAKNRITKEESDKMMKYYNWANKMWELPKEKVVLELSRFAREFNKDWRGNNKEFLYLKIFKTPEELGKFVVESTIITKDNLEFQEKIGATEEEWLNICKNATKNKECGERFRKILEKNLTEII